MAVTVADNAKTQKYSPCNASESLVVARGVAAEFLPKIGAIYAAKGVEMRCCTESKAILASVNGANLTDANLSRTNLTYASFVSANLTNVNLTSANLSYAWLVSANLTYAYPLSANFTGAWLVSANLTYANLTSAIFSGGNRFGATWYYATCPNGTVTSTSC